LGMLYTLKVKRSGYQLIYIVSLSKSGRGMGYHAWFTYVWSLLHTVTQTTAYSPVRQGTVFNSRGMID
jgi:hypothetical protein